MSDQSSVSASQDSAEEREIDETTKYNQLRLNLSDGCSTGEYAAALSDDDEFTSDLPNILIITGVPEEVFDDAGSKEEFETLFREFDSEAEFLYLKTFRRARIIFDFPRSATRARICLHERTFHGATIKCYFAQPVEANDSSPSSQFLLPPKPEKQFLISPPCSPPDGWESVHEKEPKINYDLIAAISNLAAGEDHEICPASESAPGIVVRACEDPEGFSGRPQILQTRCPPTT